MTDVNPTPVETIAAEVIKEEQTAVADYKAAQPAAESVEADLKPVLGGEPALILGTLVAVIIAVLALTGVVDVSTADGIVTSAGPLVAGIITRFFVSPATR